MITFRNSRVLKVASRTVFFFSLGVFVLEAFLDINPTNVTVVNSQTSVSFYVYMTFSNMLQYFSIGFVLLAIASVLFGFSKYRFIPLVYAGIVAAFYYQVVLSPAMLSFYQSTYACHYVYSNYQENYFCPLSSMIQGNPNIPLQGDVTAFIAFVGAVVSFAISKVGGSLRVAVLDMFLMASSVLCTFEILVYFFESEWYTTQITYYQQKIHLGSLTNQELLAISAVVFLIALLLRIRVVFRSEKGKKTLPTGTIGKKAESPVSS